MDDLKPFSPSIDWSNGLVDSLIWTGEAWAIAALGTLAVLALIARFTVWGGQFWAVTGAYFTGRHTLERIAKKAKVVFDPALFELQRRGRKLPPTHRHADDEAWAETRLVTSPARESVERRIRPDRVGDRADVGGEQYVRGHQARRRRISEGQRLHRLGVAVAVKDGRDGF